MKTIDRLLDDIDSRAQQGLDEFTVSFAQSDIGIRNRLDAATPIVVERIQDAGHAVLNTSGGGWSYEVHLLVRPAHRAAVDPALAKLRRSMAVIDQEPQAANAAAATSPADVAAITRWMGNEFDSGRYRAVWERRLQLGYGLASDGLVRIDWFWVNAFPAIAALRLGLEDHPFVATCAAFADEAYQTGAANVDEAMAEIRTAFR